MVRKNRGFTLIELIIVVSTMGLLVAIAVPSLSAAVRSARKSACASNLSGIGRSMLMYAASEKSYPTILPPKTAAKVGKWFNPPLALQCDDGRDMYAKYFGSATDAATVPGGDPFANQWLLVAEGYESNSKQYVCPSDPNEPTPAQVRYSPPVWAGVGKFLNFGTAGDALQANSTLSYGFQYPWSGITAAVPRWWSGDGNSSRVLAADMGPTMSPPTDDPTATSSVGNSKNHGGRGQNVLFADGHVSFELTNAAGINGDNIYTGAGGKIYVLPGGQKLNTVVSLNADYRDTLLVPGNP